MTWLFIGLGVWIAVAIPAALLIGRAIRVADDRRAAEAGPGSGQQNFVASEAPPVAAEPETWSGPPTVPWAPPAQPRRRPPVVRAPVSRTERKPSHRDSGVL